MLQNNGNIGEERWKFPSWVLRECPAGDQTNKLHTLTKYVSHSVFEYIDEIDDYDQCILRVQENQLTSFLSH